MTTKMKWRRDSLTHQAYSMHLTFHRNFKCIGQRAPWLCGQRDRNPHWRSNYSVSVWLAALPKTSNWTTSPLLTRECVLRWLGGWRELWKQWWILLSKIWPSINTAWRHLDPVSTERHRSHFLSQHTKSPLFKCTPTNNKWMEASPEPQSLPLSLSTLPVLQRPLCLARASNLLLICS